MRLVRKKLYRAFPELDRFEDEQCRRFVAAANASWRRRIGRWVVAGGMMLGLGFGSLIGAIKLGDALDEKAVFGGTIGYTGLGILFVVGFAVAFGSGLIARDWMLRRRVRRVIRRCGACPDCGYSLLGLRVGTDMRVTCPECGRVVEVDPALGELSTDAAGAAVYRPLVTRDDAATVARQRRRRRRFVKWSAIATVSGIALLAGAYGLWWMSLTRQATLAVAERSTRSDLEKLRLSMWATGPEFSENGESSAEQYCRFAAIVTRVRERQRAIELGGVDSDRLGIPAIHYEADVLLAETSPAAWDKRNGEQRYDATLAMTLRVLREMREDGTIASMREILALRAPMREYEVDWKDPFISVLMMDLGAARTASRLNKGRMILARHAENKDEYVEALEEVMAAARIVERQGTLIEMLVGSAMQSLALSRVLADHGSYPNDEWTAAVLEAIVRRSEREELWRVFENERIGSLDTVQWFFADPSRAQRGQLGLGGWEWFYGTTSARMKPFTLGTYAGNRDALNQAYAVWVKDLRLPQWQRKGAAPGPTGYPFVDEFLPSVTRAIGSDQLATAELHRCVATLAADRYRWATGRWPTTPEDIAPFVAKQELLIDPQCGRPYLVGFFQEAGESAARFHVLSGDDDRGLPPPPSSATTGAKERP